MFSSRMVALGLLTFAASSCESNKTADQLPLPRLPPTSQSVVTSNNQVFQVGDSLELLVEEDPSFNHTYEVREGGYILIPKVGRIPIVGLSRDQAEAKVKETLQKQQLKQATVFVERRNKGYLDPNGQTIQSSPRMSIYLTGGVSRPGKHLVPLAAGGQPLGVYETLLVTGGFAKFGDVSKVKIMRLDGNGLRKQMIVDVRKISAGKLPDVPIGEGDIIDVPEKVFGF
jgi:protein involved in polysaccharide export with SLBB domain